MLQDSRCIKRSQIVLDFDGKVRQGNGDDEVVASDLERRPLHQRIRLTGKLKGETEGILVS